MLVSYMQYKERREKNIKAEEAGFPNIVINLENSKCMRFFDFMFTYFFASITFISIMRVRFLKN